MDAAHAAPRLGEVLVRQGLLSDDQLHAALAEQARTGERLGKILVEHGVPAHTIAMALADQAGGMIRTEYGVATGWRGTPAAAGLLREQPMPMEPQDEAARLRAQLDQKERALAEREAAWRQKCAEVEEKERALADAGAALEARGAELEAVRNELARVAAERDALHARGSSGDDGGEESDEYVVIAAVNGRYVLQVARGALPEVGTVLRLPAAPDVPLVVTQQGRRRCLYAAQAPVAAAPVSA